MQNYINSVYTASMLHALALITPNSTLRTQYISTLLTHDNIDLFDQKTFAADSLGVKDVRAIAEFLQMRALNSPYKAVIIEADTLTIEAQQALLKTLEEPPQHSKIFLCLSNEKAILPTILSRTSLIYLREAASVDSSQDAYLFWQEIMSLSIGERLKKAQTLPTDRSEALTWVQKQLKELHHELHTRSKEEKYIALILSSCLKAAAQLEQNNAVKLVLDQLLLHVPQITIETNSRKPIGL